jgi:hypothetical protein
LGILKAGIRQVRTAEVGSFECRAGEVCLPHRAVQKSSAFQRQGAKNAIVKLALLKPELQQQWLAIFPRNPQQSAPVEIDFLESRARYFRVAQVTIFKTTFRKAAIHKICIGKLAAAEYTVDVYASGQGLHGGIPLLKDLIFSKRQAHQG